LKSIEEEIIPVPQNGWDEESEEGHESIIPIDSVDEDDVAEKGTCVLCGKSRFDVCGRADGRLMCSVCWSPREKDLTPKRRIRTQRVIHAIANRKRKPVYFVADCLGSIKIGESCNPKQEAVKGFRRFHAGEGVLLAIAKDVPEDILSSVPHNILMGYKTDAIYHHYFRDLHIRGEHYHAGPRLLDFIETLELECDKNEIDRLRVKSMFYHIVRGEFVDVRPIFLLQSLEEMSSGEKASNVDLDYLDYLELSKRLFMFCIGCYEIFREDYKELDDEDIDTLAHHIIIEFTKQIAGIVGAAFEGGIRGCAQGLYSGLARQYLSTFPKRGEKGEDLIISMLLDELGYWKITQVDKT